MTNEFWKGVMLGTGGRGPDLDADHLVLLVVGAMKRGEPSPTEIILTLIAIAALIYLGGLR